jgi:hypothetical protein
VYFFIGLTAKPQGRKEAKDFSCYSEQVVGFVMEVRQVFLMVNG